MTALAFSCTCGTVRGHVSVPGASAGNHVVCHCPDCRAAELWLEQPDPSADGVEIWQTIPDLVTIEAGADQLALMQFSPRGLFRWYARCCKAPMFNTLRKPRLSFVGISANRLADTAPLGPVIGHAFMAKPEGGYRHTGFNRIGLRVVRMMALANLTGRWRQNPFFDAAGAPVVAPEVLPKDARKRLGL